MNGLHHAAQKGYIRRMNDQAMRAKAQTSQFEEILDALKKAASGDYSVKLNTTSENNELSQIALAVNDLLKSAHDRISKVLAAAENSAKNAERYRHILDNIEEGYFEVDLKGNLLFFNEFLPIFINDRMNIKRSNKLINEIFFITQFDT